MTAATAPWRRLRARWESFWFTPESTAPIEVFRIVFGVVITVWTLSLIPVLVPFFGARPALPETRTTAFGMWTLLSLLPSTALVWLLWLLTLAAAVALTLGYRTRVAALLVFVALVSIERRAPLAFNAGDDLLRVLAFYLVLSPAGTAVSLDRRLSGPARI